jgi:GntR family transcriptional repressor for pyruvate dehydrogenase complex
MKAIDLLATDLMFSHGDQRSERIAQQVVDYIDLNKLHAGDRLPPERDLARNLQVSRPSMREALRILQAQGKVEIRHGQGTFVAQPQTAKKLQAALLTADIDIEELFEMRQVFEIPAAGWAANRRTKEQLRLMRSTLNQLNLLGQEALPDYDVLQKLDAEFHLRIVEAASNRFLNQSVGVLQTMLNKSMETTLRLPGRIEESRHNHEDIFAAIEAGDAEAAERAAAMHIMGAYHASGSAKKQ